MAISRNFRQTSCRRSRSAFACLMRLLDDEMGILFGSVLTSILFAGSVFSGVAVNRRVNQFPDSSAEARPAIPKASVNVNAAVPRRIVFPRYSFLEPSRSRGPPSKQGSCDFASPLFVVRASQSAAQSPLKERADVFSYLAQARG